MKTRISLALSALLPLFVSLPLLADQVKTVAGDLFSGKVISLNADTLVLQNDSLGTVRVPRAKVAVIVLGTNAVPQSSGSILIPPVRAATTPATAGADDFSAMMRQLGTNSALIQQVQNRFLAGAGPEANQKFNELLGGLMNGTLSLNDLRNEAKASADQLRALKRDLGEDGWALDGYLSILDNFLREAGPAGVVVNTNSVQKRP
jgi:hypothetical protein